MKWSAFHTATFGHPVHSHEQHGVQCHCSRCGVLCMFCAESHFAVMTEHQQQQVKGVPQRMYNNQPWLAGGH